MVYHHDIPIGPEPIPFGSIVKLVDGKMVPSSVADMCGIAKRPNWAIKESAYQPGQKGTIQSEGFILSILPDGSGTIMVELRKGKIQ